MTLVSGGQQGPLAELLGHPEQTSAEVGRRRGVLGKEGGQAQQAGRLTQALEVLGILGEPCAEHGAHSPTAVRAREGQHQTPPAPEGLVKLQSVGARC